MKINVPLDVTQASVEQLRGLADDDRMSYSDAALLRHVANRIAQSLPEPLPTRPGAVVKVDPGLSSNLIIYAPTTFDDPTPWAWVHGVRRSSPEEIEREYPNRKIKSDGVAP